MVSPAPPLPPLSLFGISAIVIVYLLVCYLVIDLIGQTEDTYVVPLQKDDSSSGLSTRELQGMPCFNFAGINSICAICLDGFQKTKLCRIFPSCSHVFHVQCIDPWLVKRLTCPTCRAPFRVRGLEQV